MVTNQMYAEEGGAHLVLVAFASQPPAYPGLRLEVPAGLQKGDGEAAPFHHAGPVLQRFQGVIYTAVLLDANQDIYRRARTDYDALLRSMVVDGV